MSLLTEDDVCLLSVCDVGRWSHATDQYNLIDSSPHAGQKLRQSSLTVVKLTQIVVCAVKALM